MAQLHLNLNNVGHFHLYLLGEAGGCRLDLHGDLVKLSKVFLSQPRQDKINQLLDVVVSTFDIEEEDGEEDDAQGPYVQEDVL